MRGGFVVVAGVGGRLGVVAVLIAVVASVVVGFVLSVIVAMRGIPVRSVAVLPAGTPAEEIEKVRSTYPGVIVVLAEKATYDGLEGQFRKGEDAALQGDGRIYIVDPIGNIMMSYPPDADPTGMKKDLKRLLKVSKLG